MEESKHSAIFCIGKKKQALLKEGKRSCKTNGPARTSHKVRFGDLELETEDEKE